MRLKEHSVLALGNDSLEYDRKIDVFLSSSGVVFPLEGFEELSSIFDFDEADAFKTGLHGSSAHLFWEEEMLNPFELVQHTSEKTELKYVGIFKRASARLGNLRKHTMKDNQSGTFKSFDLWRDDRKKLDQHSCFVDILKPCFETDVWHREPKFTFVSWTQDSTNPFFPPKTSEQRLLVLGDMATDVAALLKTNAYEEALKKLDGLNDSIMNMILHGELTEEMRANLDRILDSLESGKQILYRSIRKENPSEIVQEHNMVDVLSGFGKMLQAYANLEEWNERMNKEWGESKRSRIQ